MNRSELDFVVELERDDMFLAGPVLTITFGWYREASLSFLAPRTLPLPRVRAVATVDVQALAAFQNPHPRIVIGSGLLSSTQELLVIAVNFAGRFHGTTLSACGLM